MRSIALILFLTTILLGDCTTNRFNGVFAGELICESVHVNGTAMPRDDENSRETELSVKIQQTRDRIAVEISRSRLLGDCELFLKIGKNDLAYLESPQTCTQSLPLEGTLEVKSNELSFVLHGYEATSSKTFRFKGYRK